MKRDRKKLPEPNLHVYGKYDTQIRVYSMRRSLKKGEGKKHQKKEIKELVIERRTLGS